MKEYKRTTATQRKTEERVNVRYFHVSKEWIKNPFWTPENASRGMPEYILGKGHTCVREEDKVSRRDVRKALGMTHRQVRKQRVKALQESQRREDIEWLGKPVGREWGGPEWED